jgi:hypothetical protein
MRAWNRFITLVSVVFFTSAVARAENILVCSDPEAVNIILWHHIYKPNESTIELQLIFNRKRCMRMELDMGFLTPGKVVTSGEREFLIYPFLNDDNKVIFLIKQRFRPLPPPTGPTEVV